MARPPHQATESGLGYSYEQAPDKWGHWLQSHAEWSAAATAAAATTAAAAAALIIVSRKNELPAALQTCLRHLHRFP